MKTLADSGVLWVLLFAVLAVVYFLPTLIGLIRGVDQLALVFVVNLIGAPALIGWPAAMFLAFGPRRRPAEQARPQQSGMGRGPTGTWPPGSWDQR